MDKLIVKIALMFGVQYFCILSIRSGVWKRQD